MGRGTLLLLGLLSVSLLAVAAVSELALSERARLVAERARRDALERARLQALALRAAIAQLEQAVGAGTPVEGVMHERLALPPQELAMARPGTYATMARDELARLLDSKQATTLGGAGAEHLGEVERQREIQETRRCKAAAGTRDTLPPTPT